MWKYCNLIGPFWSRDRNTRFWLALHYTGPLYCWRLARKQIDWNTHSTKKMFNNSSLFSQHQSSLLTPCTSHIFNKDGNDSFPRIAFLSTSITIALLPPVVVAGNAMIWAAVWRKILWGHHFIYLWVVWFSPICVRESSPNLSIL